MKILQVVNSMDPAGGGVARAVTLLHFELERRGNAMEVLCVDDPAAPWLADCPAPCHATGPGRSSYRYSRRMREWLQEQAGRFDAVILHGLWQHAGLAVRSACLEARTPYFVFPHGMLDPWFKTEYPLKHLKKWLYWPWGEYRVLRDAASVFFTCEEERRLARQSFWLYSCREEVVGLGVDDPPQDNSDQIEAFFSQFPQLREKRFFLFLGRLHPKKGIEMLLGAFGQILADHPDVHLVIAGQASGVGVDSDYERHLRELTKQLCVVGHVHFVGLLRGLEKWGALRRAEAFVLFSHQENFGLAVVEALACGTPVLISGKVNIWREIEEAGAGLIANANEADALRVLRTWSGSGADFRDECRVRARACFKAHFTTSRLGDGIARELHGDSLNNASTAT